VDRAALPHADKNIGIESNFQMFGFGGDFSENIYFPLLFQNANLVSLVVQKQGRRKGKVGSPPTDFPFPMGFHIASGDQCTSTVPMKMTPAWRRTTSGAAADINRRLPATIAVTLSLWVPSDDQS
jgi:hypothetical protein